MTGKKKCSGGARVGAGRPITGKTSKKTAVMFRCEPADKAAMTKRAAAAEMSLSAYILARCLPKN